MTKRGISWIENLFYNQKGEHRESFFKFILIVTGFALLGSILGGLLDKLVNWLQDSKFAWYQCFGFLILQLLITSVVFFLMLKFIVVRPVPFDDWMINTFAGFLFTITYFTSQETLTKNSECAIN
jgi:hypothetical protein